MDVSLQLHGVKCIIKLNREDAESDENHNKYVRLQRIMLYNYMSGLKLVRVYLQ